MRSLEERFQNFEQKKARLADTAARLKLAEKKMHARRIFVIGNLLDKVGLLQADDNALYGAFLAIAKDMNDAETQRRWSASGAQALEEERREAQQGYEAVILTFSSPPTRETSAQLRAAGFRFNKILRHWEGVAEFQHAEAIAATYQGVASRHGVERSPPIPAVRTQTNTPTISVEEAVESPIALLRSA